MKTPGYVKGRLLFNFTVSSSSKLICYLKGLGCSKQGGLLCTPIKYLEIIYLKDSTNMSTNNESSEMLMFI